ncbi:MAG: hypothetical protein GC179_07805 [Anaerolineaceae bacterium]|nr:hypothetical protein [Anaerolineaceae bacterium]
MVGTIPERQPIGDSFTGAIIQVGGSQALITLEPLTEAVIATGTFLIRYGLRFLGKPHISIVPGLLVLDRGEMMTGEEAWEFLLKHSNIYPRSEVFGYKNDGVDEMMLIRNLDMALSPEVLVYADNASIKPIAQPTALISTNTSGLSERLLSYLPRYSSLAEWQAEMKT